MPLKYSWSMFGTFLMFALCSLTCLVVAAAPPKDEMTLKDLRIGHCPPSGDTSINYKGTGAIKFCDIHAPDDFPPGTLKLLANVKDLDYLRVDNRPVDSEVVGELTLDADDAEMKDLGALTQLKFLKIQGFDFSSGQRMRYLTPLKELRRLNLKDCNVTLRMLLNSSEPRDKVTELFIENDSAPVSADQVRTETKPYTEQEIRALAKLFPNLESLVYGSKDPFHSAALEAFGQFPKLTKLTLYKPGNQKYQLTNEHKRIYQEITDAVRNKCPSDLPPGMVPRVMLGFPELPASVCGA